MKKVLILVVIVILLLPIVKFATQYSVDLALNGNNRTASGESLYFDDILINEEQKSLKMKNLSHAFKASKNVLDHYFKGNFMLTKFERKGFFNSFDDMIQAFRKITFEQAFEHDESDKNISLKFFNFQRARKISRLAALFSGIKSSDTILAEQQGKRDFICDVEALLKYSTLVENRGRTLIEKMISIVIDKMAVKIVFANHKLSSLKEEQIKRINVLFSKRLSHSNDLKSVMQSEMQWAKIYLAPLYKTHPIRMKLYALMNSDPIEDYKRIMDLKFNGAKKEEIVKVVQKSCHLIRIMIPNFTKAEKKIEELNAIMKSFNDDFTSKVAYKKFNIENGFNDLPFDWGHFILN